MPRTIATLVPGSGPLDPGENRRIQQYDELVAWLDVRMVEAEERRRASGGSLSAAQLTTSLGIGLDDGLPGAARVSVGSADAETVVIAALEGDLSDAVRTSIHALAAAGARVIVPGFVRREAVGDWSERLGKDRRHILHRLAFPLGRTLVGLEASALAAIIGEESSNPAVTSVAVVGEGDGARAAIAALATLPGRNIPVALVAITDPASFPGRRDGGPVDRLIHNEAGIGGPTDWLRLVDPAPAIVLSAEDLVARAADCLPPNRSGAPSSPASGTTELAVARNATYEHWRAWLVDDIARAGARRRERWNLGVATPDDRPERAAALRDAIARSIGAPPAPAPARPDARTRLLRVTGSFVAYEVVLDVDTGLTAWGHLLVPRDPGPFPAVICQHGLDGSPGDVTGVAAINDDKGDNATDAYHAFGARLAGRGFVVFAPYLTVPSPQDELINPLVARATYLGEQRSATELRKLRRIVDWLSGLPDVDASRIGYYGLSYGGHAALWLTPLEPRIAVAVVSGHFNDWTAKTTDSTDGRSFLAHPDEDFTVWRGIEELSHIELLAAAWPRPTLIEAGNRDPITRGDWLDAAQTEALALAERWGWGDRFEFDRFDGIHEVTGVASFEFLERWLRPERPLVRDYVYDLPPGRDLPGIMDQSATTPYVTAHVRVGEVLDVPVYLGTASGRFAGCALRLSRGGRDGALDQVRVRYGRSPGAADIGEATIDGSSIAALWDLWYDVRIPPVEMGDATSVFVRLSPAGNVDGELLVYGPRPLGATDDRVRPAVRPVDHPLAGEPTHAFARAMHADAAAEFDWAPAARPTVTWRLSAAPDDATSAVAVRWLRDALRPITGEATESAVADIAVELRIDAAIGGHRRSHRVTSGPDRVAIAASSPKGLLAGAAFLAERIAAERRLPHGDWERTERVPDRITTGVLPGGTRYAEASGPSPYSDALLDRIARGGFTGVWTWLNLEEASFASHVFPELDDHDSPARLDALADFTRRAAVFGLDTWIYLAAGYLRPIPEAFWTAHPEVRGGEGWLGPALCTSDPRVLAYHREVVDHVLDRAPGVAGFFAIFDIEGFYFCGSEEEARVSCPRCRGRSSADLALEALTNLEATIRGRGGDQRLVAWSYGWHPEWVETVAERLPATVVSQVDFTKGVPVTRYGVTEPAGDYTLSEVGPSPVFTRLRDATALAGRPFFAKTEHAISLDAIFAPYLPVLDQLRERAAAVRASEPAGWFANWEHYGFLVPFPAQLLNAYAWDPLPDTERVLDDLAAARYGTAAVAVARAAWTAFSTGIRAFPYSDPVARSPGPIQKGPTQPLWLDATVPSVAHWRSWQNDLDWTAPWGPARARSALSDTLGAFRQGRTLLEGAVPLTSGRDRDRLDGDVRLAAVLVASIETAIALIDWITTRGELALAPGPERPAILDRLAGIARAQRARAVEILPVLEADSRLGFAQDGGGVVRGGLFTPALLRQAIGLLDDLLARQLPAAGGPGTAIPWCVAPSEEPRTAAGPAVAGD